MTDVNRDYQEGVNKMRTIEAKKNKTVCIGYQGENEATRVLFPLSDFGQNTEDYEFSLMIQNKNDDFYSPELYQLSEDRKYLVWIPTLQDTETAGIREAEIKAQREHKVAKSYIYKFSVNRSL